MRRLLPIACVIAALSIAGGANAVPVNPVPHPSATFDGDVHAVAYWGNVIYVGGEFTYATANGKRVPRSRLAAIDAQSGALLNWAPSADGTVVDLDVDAGGVYIAGDFRAVNLTGRDSLAKLDRASGGLMPWQNHQIYGHPHTMAIANGRVYLGGTITTVDGVSARYVAAFDAATGALDRGWVPVPSGPVHSMFAAPDRVYLGGLFGDVNGVPKTQKLAAVRPDTGQVDTTFTSRVHARIAALHLQGDTLYAGVGGTAGRAMAMDLTGTPKWTVTVDGDVQCVTVLDGLVYIGGHFDNVSVAGRFEARVKLAAIDPGGTLQPWTANASGVVGVRTLVANPELGQLVAGGSFRYVNGVEQRRFALFTLAG